MALPQANWFDTIAVIVRANSEMGVLVSWMKNDEEVLGMAAWKGLCWNNSEPCLICLIFFFSGIRAINSNNHQQILTIAMYIFTARLHRDAERVAWNPGKRSDRLMKLFQHFSAFSSIPFGLAELKRLLGEAGVCWSAWLGRGP